MLLTKPILAPFEEDDGVRISVMSRHTLNDGRTPHPDITPSRYDDWLSHLAPPARLIGAYYKRGLSWEQFEQGYLKHIREPDVRVIVEDLARRSLDAHITLLCIEATPDHCHRRLLALECQRYEPALALRIR